MIHNSLIGGGKSLLQEVEYGGCGFLSVAKYSTVVKYIRTMVCPAENAVVSRGRRQAMKREAEKIRNSPIQGCF